MASATPGGVMNHVDLDFKVCTAANPSMSQLAFFGISLVVEFDCSMRQFRREALSDCRKSPSGVAEVLM